MLNFKLRSNEIQTDINLHIILQLKWGDSYDGHGEMYYDYNHAPKHAEPYHAPKPAYKPAGRR